MDVYFLEKDERILLVSNPCHFEPAWLRQTGVLSWQQKQMNLIEFIFVNNIFLLLHLKYLKLF